MERTTIRKAKPSPTTKKKVETAMPKRKFKYLRGYRELVPDPWGLES